MPDDYYEAIAIEYAFEDEDTWVGPEPTADISMTHLFDLSDVTVELVTTR